MRKYTIECKITVYREDELDPKEAALVEQAKKATDNSYAPFSNFSVGSAVLLDDGTVVTGCNQENAAFPSGLCAERTALFAANAQYPDRVVVMMAVAARNGKHFLSQPIPPCGACRQVISGVESRYHSPIRILLYGTEGVHVVNGVTNLLPLQFSESDME